MQITIPQKAFKAVELAMAVKDTRYYLMRPNHLNEAIAVALLPNDAMAYARSNNASIELLARLNTRRRSFGLPELDKYPSDLYLLEYFKERMGK